MKNFILTFSAFALVLGVLVSFAQMPKPQVAPIRLGELMTYSEVPRTTHAYRNGWQLALEEVNGAGGVLGRQLEVLSRDDLGDPGTAVRVAQELVSRDHVCLLLGTIYDHVGLAVSDFAKQNRVLFIKPFGGTDAHIWQHGHRYTFRLEWTNYAMAEAFAQEAAKLPAKRWAAVSPNYEFGRAATANFKQALARLRPDVQWVAEQYPMFNKIDDAATVQALLHAKPEAVFTVLYGPDLPRFIREARLRGLLGKCQVVGFIAGIPSYLEPLGAEAPTGWISIGYPYRDLNTPVHQAFYAAYLKKFRQKPELASYNGYVALKMIARAIADAGSTNTEALVAALEKVRMDTPLGPIAMRATDHQSSWPVFVGKTGFRDGVPSLVDWKQIDAGDFMPTSKP